MLKNIGFSFLLLLTIASFLAISYGATLSMGTKPVIICNGTLLGIIAIFLGFQKLKDKKRLINK